jgi:hypothetical protein
MSATDTLRGLLTDTWQPAVEVQGRAKALGLTHDQVRTARRKLGVSRKLGGVARRDDRWWWRLPPNGCVTCGRPWNQGWALGGTSGDYWADRDISSSPMPEEKPAAHHEGEPPSPAYTPSPVPSEPARCSACGKAAALPRGASCPFWNGGLRCRGVLM